MVQEKSSTYKVEDLLELLSNLFSPYITGHAEPKRESGKPKLIKAI